MSHNDVIRHGLRKSNEDFGKALRIDEGIGTNSQVDTAEINENVCVGASMTWDV
jgi:hypothetical protein